MESKVCSKCQTEKTLDNFAINSKGSFGRKSVCKVCSNKAQSALAARRMKEDPDLWRKYRYEKHLKSAYGLTPQDYQDLLDKHKHKCAICGRAENIINDKLYVDHCHDTGIVRGVLCYYCNTLLGMAFDNESILTSAVDYLSRSKSKGEAK